MKRILFLTTMLAIALIPAFAMAQGMGMGPGAPGGMGPGMPGGMARMWADLNLSPDQIQKLEANHISYLKETLPIRNQIAIKRLEMRELWLQPTPNQAQILAKQKEINALMGQLQEKTTNFLFQSRTVLSPDQQAKLTANLSRYGMMRGMMRGNRMGQMWGPYGSRGMHGCPGYLG